MISSVGLLVLVLMIALITALLTAAFRSGSMGAIVGIVVAVGIIFLLLSVSYVSVRKVPSTVVQSVPRDMAHPGSTRDVELSSDQTEWARLDPAQFEAVLYPSQESAAEALAFKTAKELEDLTTGTSEEKEQASSADYEIPVAPEQTTVTSSISLAIVAPKQIPMKSVAVFQQTLQKALSSAKITLETGSDEPAIDSSGAEDGLTRLYLNIIKENATQAPWDSTAQESKGEWVCIIKDAANLKTAAVNYVEKPWVDQYDQFISSNPHGDFVVCSSHKLAASALEAYEDSLQQVRRLRLNAGRVNSKSIRVEADESLIVDRFTQRLKRPYGDVWREAILVNLDGKAADKLKRTAIHSDMASLSQQQHERHSYLSIILTTAAVFGLTALGASLLNMLTEGYFRGRLMLLVLSIGVAGVVILVSMA